MSTIAATTAQQAAASDATSVQATSPGSARVRHVRKTDESLWRKVAAATGVAVLLAFGGGRAALAEANGVAQTHTVVSASAATVLPELAVLPEEARVTSGETAG